ncbi:MAG: ATP-binding cassette domain-containing protein [Enterocloster bolteae]
MLESVMRENAGETHYSSADEMQATAKSMLNKLGITEHDALTSTLSGGQRKRVALASGAYEYSGSSDTGRAYQPSGQRYG